MAHEQLSFEILHSILHNADDDEHAGAAEHQSLHAGDALNDKGRYCDKAEEQCSCQRDAKYDTVEIIRRGATGTNARNEASILLENFRNILLLEDDGSVENM